MRGGQQLRSARKEGDLPGHHHHRSKSQKGNTPIIITMGIIVIFGMGVVRPFIVLSILAVSGGEMMLGKTTRLVDGGGCLAQHIVTVAGWMPTTNPTRRASATTTKTTHLAFLVGSREDRTLARQRKGRPDNLGERNALRAVPLSIQEAEDVGSPPLPPVVLLESAILGQVHRIRMPGEDQDDSFLKAMGVPTFAASGQQDKPGENKDKVPISSLDNIVDMSNSAPNTASPRGLEGVLNQGPAFVLDHVLSRQACETLIDDCEHLGFGNFQTNKNTHGALQVVVSQALADAVARRVGPHIDVGAVEDVYHELQRHTRQDYESQEEEKEDVRLGFVGLNRRWRIYRYDNACGNETFAPHIDAGFPPSGLNDDGTTLLWDVTVTADDDSSSSSLNGSQEEDKRRPPVPEIVSRLTVLLYLNDDFVGGETNFYQPRAIMSAPPNDPSHPAQPSSSTPTAQRIASVRPRAGSVLVFHQVVGEDAVDYARQHWPLHEGSPVFPLSHGSAGAAGRPKYVIRSDALFVTQKERLPLDDALFRHDHLVRQTFLPQSGAYHPSFLNHVRALYNPHMGVEHMGSLLYQWIRFTKVRRIVEIGAGYTTVWILQALADNDAELQRIRELERSNACRLLDYEWTVAPTASDEQTPARLLCIDNCLHQKETATGAAAVAQALGLHDSTSSSYLEFCKGDAFDLLHVLEPNSVDLLWCDFGVGSRMAFFVSQTWHCLRPGGYLLCHSSVTNTNTRSWLEAIRRQAKQQEPHQPLPQGITDKDENNNESSSLSSQTGIPLSDEYVELSLLEPHKSFQNSVTILQKRTSNGTQYVEPIYSQYA